MVLVIQPEAKVFRSSGLIMKTQGAAGVVVLLSGSLVRPVVVLRQAVCEQWSAIGCGFHHVSLTGVPLDAPTGGSRASLLCGRRSMELFRSLVVLRL